MSRRVRASEGAKKSNCFSGDMCGGKTPLGERDDRPSHRPTGAWPRAINASISTESLPAGSLLKKAAPNVRWERLAAYLNHHWMMRLAP